MAATPAPIVWDFNRPLGSDAAVHVGGTAHYYDETAQSLFINGGLKTRLCSPTDGHWRDAALSDPSQFIDTVAYTRVGIDHPANGTVYFAAVVGGVLRFMRYQYAADLSNITDSVTYTAQIDNPVTQISASIKNVDNEWIDAEASLFEPGARLQLGAAYGEGDVYLIGTAYVDECDHDPQSSTVPISGRNAIGFYLKDSTFGDATGDKTDTYDGLVKRFLSWAGYTKYNIMTGYGNCTTTVKASDTILAAIEYLHNTVYYNASLPMAIAETADGTVVSGYQSFVDQYLPPSYFTFVLGREVFKRKTTKRADAAFVAVYVTGKGKDTDAEGKETTIDLTPVQLAVPHYEYWALPGKKIKHITAPENINTQALLQWYAEQQVKALQYVGIGEDFTGPLRPQMLVGDVAEITEDGQAVTLGIITEVKHTIGVQGWTTQFSVDSGGDISVVEGGVRTTASGQYGYNRRQRMTDIIRKVSGV